MNAIEIDPIRAKTPPEMLENIDRQIEERVRYLAAQSRGIISARIRELEQEWDIERWLDLNMSAAGLSGLALGIAGYRRWLWLASLAAACLLQQVLKGWSPPISLLRRAGLRTRGEIERERIALKALRGDFDTVVPKADANLALRAQEILNAVEA
jgi:hypothetical protein